MVKNSEMSKLNDIFDKLIGAYVTKVVAGGSAGSIIGIYLVQNGNLAVEAENEWYFAVESSWRIDTPNVPLTSSMDDNAKDGFMIQGVNSLIECVISEVVITRPALDIVITFSQGKRLSVFSDAVREGICWYLLGPQELEVSVEPAGTLVFG